MKVNVSRGVALVATLVLAIASGSVTASAQSAACPTSPNYSPDFSTNANCTTPNHTAMFVANGLQLTANTGNQVGSAWYNLKQPVQNGFSTTFQFSFTNPSNPPADGIAFVIQNSAAGASAIGFTGGNGGPLGYGDNDGSTNPSTGEGITNSLAIEFDDFQNGWDPAGPHVAVQTCGAGGNTSHHGQLCGGTSGSDSTVGSVISTANFADGAVHIVTITYHPACSTCSPTTPANIHVILDNTDINPSGFAVDLSTLGLDNGNAYVGFTGATGGDFATQDVLSWTFTPASQATVVTGTITTIPFQDNTYDYSAQLTGPSANSQFAVQVFPVLVPQSQCDALVQASYPGSPSTFHCFLYSNADGQGHEMSVMFEVTCPQEAGGTCGSETDQDFFALLGTDFNFVPADNPNLVQTQPLPGWLKGDGTVSGHPCTPNPDHSALFQSNQIQSFNIDSIDPAHAKGSSGGTGSCWVATYNTPNVAPPPPVIVSPANGATYAAGTTVLANYSCSAVSNGASSPVGPYLTVAQCTGNVPNGAAIDTTAGTHTFTVATKDSGSDHATASVTYNVVASTDLAIVNLALPKVATGGKLTYAIGVGDLGPAAAVNVVVSDTLPSGTTLVSASGSVISCSIVNKKLSCPTTPVTCSGTSTVTCNVGSLAPLSISSLNGAAIAITVKVTAPSGTTLKDTATVTGTNTDSKPGNNSSTASTSVTAH